MGIIEPVRDKFTLEIHAEIIFRLSISHINKSAVFHHKAMNKAFPRINIPVLIKYSHFFPLFPIIPCAAPFFSLRTSFCSESDNPLSFENRISLFKMREIPYDESMDNENKQPYIIEIFDYTVLILIGASLSGKSSFAATHFRPDEIVSDNAPNFQRTLQVCDGNYLETDNRKELLKAARAHQYQRVAVVFDVSLEELLRRNSAKTYSAGYLEMQQKSTQSVKNRLKQEGFDRVYVLNEQDMENVQIKRAKGNWDLRENSGPFDIIGDVHGCYDALKKLIRKLGYQQDEDGHYFHPEKRTVIFTGDVVDRGEQSLEVLQLIMQMERDNAALMVMGNHDERLLRYLEGSNVEVAHGLEATAREMEAVGDKTREEIAAFLRKQPAYLWLDKGSLVVVHAGIKRAFLGKNTREIREYCLYGPERREYDRLGFPSTEDWSADYNDDLKAVFGHIPAERVYKIHNTYGVDTACAFGYYLSALRYPEMQVEQVRNRKKK